MTTKRKLTGVVMGLLLAGWCGKVEATPSTTYWTPTTSDIQPYKVLHFGIDNYFTIAEKADSKKQGAFPTDVGLTIGVLPFEKVQAEVGIDAFYPSDDPYYLNAKIGTPEGALFASSPALNVGVFGVGTKKNVTNQNVLDLIAGHTLPFDLGRIHAGWYIGNRHVLKNGDGEPDATGWMIAYDRTLIADKLSIAADWMSGKNALGGGGVGLAYNFSKNVSLLTGPVWFNDQTVNGAWKWSTQLDVNF